MLVAFAPVVQQGLVLVSLGGFRVGTPVGPGINLMTGPLNLPTYHSFGSVYPHGSGN